MSSSSVMITSCDFDRPSGAVQFTSTPPPSASLLGRKSIVLQLNSS